LLDPAKAVGGASDFFNFNPLDGNASDVVNREVNYGWEYVWHCHILGHEENDMMRVIGVAQPPEKPVSLTATTVTTGVKLDWKDDSVISNWVTIQRSTESTFSTPALITTFNVVKPECADQAGCDRTYTDTTAPANTSVYYRIMANNTVGAGDGKLDTPRNTDGSYGGILPAELSTLTPGFAGYANVTANSDWSTAASRLAIPVAGVSTTSLTFAQLINTTSVAQTVTVTNTSNSTPTPGNLLIANVALETPEPSYSIANSCPSSLAPGASCNINVTFTPNTTGPTINNALIITDNTGGTINSTQLVTLNGNVTTPKADLSSASLSFGDALVGTTSTAQTVTLSNSGTGPLSIASIVAPTSFVQTNNCGSSLSASASCTINVSFKPTVPGAAPAGSLTITDNTGGVAGSSQLVALSAGTGVTPLVPAFTSSLSSTPPATVSMSWTASSSVATQPDSYQVQRTTASTNAALNCSTAVFSNLGATTTSLTATDTTMVASRTYCYRVVATNVAGNFTSTPPDKITTLAAPSAPTAATITAITQNSLTLGWTAGAVTATAPAPTGYQVQQCQGVNTTGNCASTGAGWIDLGNVNAATTSLGVTNLNAGTSYLFRIRAYDPLTSNWLLTPATGAHWTIPAAPATPTTTNVTATSLRLNWTAPATGTVQSYTVQRATDAGFTTGLGTTTGVAATATSLITGVTTGLTGNTTYYFRVVAVTTGGSTNSASVSQLTTVATPTTVTRANGTAGGTVTAGLNWTTLSGLTYNIQWATTAAALTANTGTIIPSATSGAQYPVTPAGAKFMKVQAVDGTNTSAWSANITVTAQ
jgi:hypothetical protein